MKKNICRKEVIEKILNYGGFPEPFIEGNQKFYNLWRKTHLDIILKQDMIYLENLRDIRSVEVLIELLSKKVTSPISYSSLTEDIQCNDKTIKRWLEQLENMYVIFRIYPFHKNVARSNLKRPKYYFYDTARVQGEGARFENLVACSLIKECQFRQDCLGEDWKLHYIGKKGGGEIDFLITENNEPKIAVEVKLSDTSLSRNFRLIKKDFPEIKKIQLVKNMKREKTFPDGAEVRLAENWLTSW